MFSALTLGVAVQPSEVEINWTMDGEGAGGGGGRKACRLQSWSSTMYRDICVYLVDKDPPSLEGRMRDYKEGKAFSYFASFWLGRYLFHLVGESCL